MAHGQVLVDLVRHSSRVDALLLDDTSAAMRSLQGSPDVYIVSKVRRSHEPLDIRLHPHDDVRRVR